MTAGYSNLGPSRSCSCHFNNKHANIIPARPSHPAPPSVPRLSLPLINPVTFMVWIKWFQRCIPTHQGIHSQTSLYPLLPSFPPLKAGGTARGTALQPHYYQHGGRWLPHCCFSMSECVCVWSLWCVPVRVRMFDVSMEAASLGRLACAQRCQKCYSHSSV